MASPFKTQIAGLDNSVEVTQADVRPATDAQITRALMPMLDDRRWADSSQAGYVERAAVIKLVLTWAVNPMADSTPPAVSRAIHNAVGRGAAYGERANAILAHLAMVTDPAHITGTLSAEKLYAPLSKEGASKLIGWLADQPGSAIDTRASVQQGSEDSSVEVPAGRYAVELKDSSVGNDLAFYKVDRPTEGRWAGRVFVNQIVGPEEQPVRGKAAATVLAQIAVDPAAASIRYGHAVQKCGVCHTRLTNKTSREAGIGPDCRKKFGW
ncbi:hypothetical protein I5G58_gp048 [Mycobacterium phage BirdsNest]|uniref:Uncharacterized protein n=1 Tax=Mycobacterium phage BirdsNest TaxID=2686231 RepID=A0A6B9L798_9CAUD|nr:hypothetical protein I5G58_gp048 [Mycobacterium phage BirdsNest]QHB37350.1 hypothetical protein PBI_BIRDSNEST_48 [Mycobacterium phage BirdsNest]